MNKFIGILVRIFAIIFVGGIFCFLYIIFSAELTLNEVVPATKEVVYRVEIISDISNGKVNGEKKILTESGIILTANINEKSFFLEKGDTITVQNNKILDIKFKD